MYLSCLLIDVGENPDRPRPGRLWLRNLYRVHQRLCMAFPSANRVSDDADFLAPFKPEDFGIGQVKVPRGANAGFLYRVDPLQDSRVVILVQSAVKPNWEYAFHNADYLLAAPPQTKSLNPSFEREQKFRFRLVANPTRKIKTKSGLDGKRNNGKRVPVQADKLEEWLVSRAETAGFLIAGDSITVQPSYIYVNGNRDGEGKRLFSARYEGILEVTDAEKFRNAVIRGIGSGKAFGFGLLSLTGM